jgi:hypothetical protein
MEQYLRAYCNYLQSDWVDWLPTAEFAANSHVSETTQTSPFFANYGIKPRFGIEPWKPLPAMTRKGLSDAQEADAFVGRMNEIHEQLRDEMTAAQAYYERQASGRRPSPAYKVGDIVWLNSRNLRTTRPSKKLDHKNLGPFRVSEKVNSRAYRLDLPTSMRIHNVFHVSLLHPAVDDPFPGQKEIPPPPEVIERDEISEEEYEVEAIQDTRRKGADIEYLVKFKRG